jgi:hypothetical protein
MENGRSENMYRRKRSWLSKTSTLSSRVTRGIQVLAYAAGIAVLANTQIPRVARDDSRPVFRGNLFDRIPLIVEAHL